MPDFENDVAILAQDVLWRRVHPDHCIYDENLGRTRPTSQAFRDSAADSPMSSARARFFAHPDEYTTRFDSGFYLTSFTAGFARDLDQQVASLPAISGEPEHVWIVGNKNPKRVKDGFTKQSRWVIAPPNSGPNP